jgi:hypothetical protein
MTEIVSTSFGIFAVGIQWYQALGSNLRNDARELAGTVGETCSCCVLVPRTETVPAHVGLGDLVNARSIGGPAAGAAALLHFPETDAAALVALDDGRWWCCAKIANMLVPDGDAVFTELEAALAHLERIQRTAQSTVTLVVDPGVAIDGWPVRQPLERLAQAANGRRLPRLNHLAAPTRIARAVAAAAVGLIVLPTAVWAGILGLRAQETSERILPPTAVSAEAPRPAEAVELCYRGFQRLLYQAGWSPVAFECVLDQTAKREFAGKGDAWSGAYVAARFTQQGGTATALQAWAKGAAVNLAKGTATIRWPVDLGDAEARGPETLLNVGLAEARLLDTATRLGEPLEVRRRGRTRLEFEVTSDVPGRHWARVLSLAGVRITRVAVAVTDAEIRWSIAGDVDAL